MYKAIASHAQRFFYGMTDTLMVLFEIQSYSFEMRKIFLLLELRSH